MRWLTFFFVLFALIVVPFLLLGERLEAHLSADIAAAGSNLAIAIIAIWALLIDVFLPIPSSIIGAVAGAKLGLLVGAMVTWLGLTLGCLVGYATGQLAGRPFLNRLVGVSERKSAEEKFSQHGYLYLLISRAIPVLSEVSILTAGTLGLSWKKFALWIFVANVPVSFVYAYAGVFAIGFGVLWAALAGVLIALLLYIALARIAYRRT